MKKILVSTVIMIAVAAIFAQETVEVEVTCPKCRGKKTMSTYEQCSNCSGTAMVEEEIHNGSMHDVNWRDVKKPTKTNRKRCPVCLKSAKRGMVKVEKDCERCSGMGKITQIKKVPSSKKK